MLHSERILGVDPGSRISGWGVIDGDAASPTLRACDVIRLLARDSFESRLALLHARIVEVVDRHEPTVAAVEAPFHGASARSALQLAHARGVILAAIASRGVAVIEYAPATVKKTVCGHGRAGKEQIASEVGRLFGARSAGGADLTDALAVAVCHQIRARFDRAVNAALEDAPSSMRRAAGRADAPSRPRIRRGVRGR